MRDDIDQLAGHFYANGLFETTFLGALVPWDDLVGEPNTGHAAVADLLISRVAHATLSANFDPLIEQWANAHKVAMRGALDGTEAVSFVATANPLLKFHGCLTRSRECTLWTQGQITDATIGSRIESCAAWMRINLPGKDLLVIGFWTDWGYLNDVLANVMSLQGLHSVTVVDPLPSDDLQIKAPVLWGKLTASTTLFKHVQASGADALDELRAGFSKVWARKFFALGKPYFEAEGKTYSAAAVDPAAVGTEELYNLRRDSEGVPYNRAARRKEPAREAAIAAFAHLLLLQVGAVRQGAWYEHGGHTIRVIHGSGQPLETVREGYNEPPAIPQAEIVICAGAQALSVPGRLIASGVGPSVVRASPGGPSRWLTLEDARAELAI